MKTRSLVQSSGQDLLCTQTWFTYLEIAGIHQARPGFTDCATLMFRSKSFLAKKSFKLTLANVLGKFYTKNLYKIIMIVECLIIFKCF